MQWFMALCRARLNEALAVQDRHRKVLHPTGLSPGRSRWLRVAQESVAVIKHLVVGAVLTPVVVGAQLELDAAGQHMPAFPVQVRLPHDLAPTAHDTRILSQVPADFFVKRAGSAIEGIVAGLAIHHSGLHPDTLGPTYGSNLFPLNLLRAVGVHNQPPCGEHPCRCTLGCGLKKVGRFTVSMFNMRARGDMEHFWPTPPEALHGNYLILKGELFIGLVRRHCGAGYPC
jgi:hypothetical protein